MMPSSGQYLTYDCISVPTQPDQSIAKLKRQQHELHSASKVEKNIESFHDNVSSVEIPESNKTRFNYSVFDDDIDKRNDDFYAKRALPSYTSSFLRPGSVFIGTQQSGISTYEVKVELKRVDMDQAMICGYLRIEGLTEDHPTLTTYFEGEIISPKYSFFTRRKEWGASEKTDIAHWSRFGPWRTISDKARKIDYVHENYQQRDHIYMRWKESFLVPDHTIRDIHGASYAGFYYICFDQVNGSISGFYYHQKSDKFQQLELTYMSNSGCYDSYEFR